MRILLDVDGLLGDFVAGARQWADERHDLFFTDEQITDYNVMTSFGLGAAAWPSFIEWLSMTRFCRDMPVYEGAKEFVSELRGLGEVVAVTSPFVGVDHWEADRRGWLNIHFGIASENVVSCARKELVNGDVLIDDKLENVEAFCSAQAGLGIVFDRPWNQGSSRTRARGYAEALALVASVKEMT